MLPVIFDFGVAFVDDLDNFVFGDDGAFVFAFAGGAFVAFVCGGGGGCVFLLWGFIVEVIFTVDVDFVDVVFWDVDG